VDLTKSETTGNALITVNGAAEVQNVAGPIDVTVTAGAYDVGTKQWEAHGNPDLPLGSLVGIHVKGNQDGPTGVCVIICTPTPQKKKEPSEGSSP